MAKHRMTILGAVHPDAMGLVEARDDIEFTVVDAALAPRDEIAAAIEGTHGIEVRTAKLDAELLGAVPDLKIVSRHGVGTDSVAVDHMTARGLPVAIAVGGNDRSVAEHTLTMMLWFARDMPLQHELGVAGDWTRREKLKAYDLEGRTLLIIGHGRIGRRVGELALAFGMRVLAYDPYISGVPDGIERVSDLEAALADADIVTVHVPKYAETTPLIGKSTVDAMRPDTVLINNARGGICDEDAVAAALHAGHLRGYGCDVFSTEPTPPENPILSAPRTLLSPHSAAMTPQGMRRMGMIAVQNVLDCFDGRLDPEMVFNRKELGW
ncbi:MAG: hydroxyacid dehydrogenase [Pseudomonadota bacterium]